MYCTVLAVCDHIKCFDLVLFVFFNQVVSDISTASQCNSASRAARHLSQKPQVCCSWMISSRRHSWDSHQLYESPLILAPASVEVEQFNSEALLTRSSPHLIMQTEASHPVEEHNVLHVCRWTSQTKNLDQS